MPPRSALGIIHFEKIEYSAGHASESLHPRQDRGLMRSCQTEM